MAPSFCLFGLTLYPYTLLMIAGAGLAAGLFALLTVRRHKGCGEENRFAVEALLIAMAAALPAAMLADALFKWVESGHLVFGGATFYGGAAGAVLVFSFILRLKKRREVCVYERLCDLAPCIPAGHALGRVGCFLGGCCFGKPTDCIFGVIFPEGSLPYEYYGAPVRIHPTQLYEAMFLALLALFLLFFCRKNAFPFYLIFYGVFRFLIEFLRGDDRGALIPGLSPAQTVSLVFVLLGILILLILSVRRPKEE